MGWSVRSCYYHSYLSPQCGALGCLWGNLEVKEGCRRNKQKEAWCTAWNQYRVVPGLGPCGQLRDKRLSGLSLFDIGQNDLSAEAGESASEEFPSSLMTPASIVHCFLSTPVTLNPGWTLESHGEVGPASFKRSPGKSTVQSWMSLFETQLSLLESCFCRGKLFWFTSLPRWVPNEHGSWMIIIHVLNLCHALNPFIYFKIYALLTPISIV